MSAHAPGHIYLTDRQREACRAALAALGAGERSLVPGETEWPPHVSRRDIEGALAKLGSGPAVEDPLDDLLAVCKALVESVEFRIDDPRAKLRDAVRAAIAKAEGRNITTDGYDLLTKEK